MGEMFRDRKSKESISRLDIAVDHLKDKIMSMLKPEQEFNLVRFARNITAEGPMPANEENLQDAFSKIKEWRPDGSTEIYSALYEAYNDPKTKEVYLISDGDARDHSELISATRRWCRLNTDQDTGSDDESDCSSPQAAAALLLGSNEVSSSSGSSNSENATPVDPGERKIPCHTVCIFSDGRSKELMKTLSGS